LGNRWAYPESSIKYSEIPFKIVRTLITRLNENFPPEVEPSLQQRAVFLLANTGRLPIGTGD
jgi:hypothetical protein